MLLVAAIVVATQGALVGPPPVTMPEAVSAAEWFCRCMDLQPAPRVTSVEFSTNDRTTDGGAPRYHVEMTPEGAARPYEVQVDAVSGDVMFASNLSGSIPMVRPPKAISDRWLRRIGRQAGLAYDAPLSRYDLVVGHVPMCNLNGDSQCAFLTQNGVFAWYLAPSAPPPAPAGHISVTESEAARLAVAERKKTVPNWPLKLETRCQKVVFFDDHANRTEWAWKVEEGSIDHGQFREGWTHYVDAETGTVIPDDRESWSRLVYRSRAPRVGLSHVPMDSAVGAIFRTLGRKMRELGRPEDHPWRVRFGPTLEVSFEDSGQLTMKPNGDLLSLMAQPVSGRMEDSAALAFGKKLILAQHPSPAEGRFQLDNQPGRMNSSVEYIQTAYGHPYLDRALATVEFGSTGTVSNYRTEPAQPRPLSRPGRLVPLADIFSKAKEMAEADVKSPSPGGKPSLLGEGWFDVSGQIHLVYRVSVPFEQPQRFRLSLRFWWGTFDAQTGELLESKY